MAYETVDHPEHYQGNSIEAIDVIEDFGLNFSLGSAIKYILRAGKKPSASSMEDLQKALWFINREIERMGAQQTPAKDDSLATLVALDAQPLPLSSIHPSTAPIKDVSLVPTSLYQTYIK